MSDLLRRQSPLGNFTDASVSERVIPSAAGFAMTERPFFGHLNLRGEAGNPAFLNGVERCLPGPVPLQPNTVTENGAVTALWLGPDEWLLITPPSGEMGLAAALRSALTGVFFAVTDVTDGQTILRVGGTHSIEILRKGCSLDLDAEAFGPGHCAQTPIDKIDTLIHCVDRTPTFDLFVRRSFADYLSRWLEDAAAEYRSSPVQARS